MYTYSYCMFIVCKERTDPSVDGYSYIIAVEGIAVEGIDVYYSC